MSDEICNGCKKDNQELKVIRLDELSYINVDIDMEFQNETHGEFWWIGSLLKDSGSEGYESIEGYWPRCRVRENHTHYWGKEFRLPEGLLLSVFFHDNRDRIVLVTGSEQWDGIQTKRNITGFICHGPAAGYRYGWQKGLKIYDWNTDLSQKEQRCDYAIEESS